jgi:hypothetical protein
MSDEITPVTYDLPETFTPFTAAEVYELELFTQHLADIEELDLPRRKTMTMTLGVRGPAVENVDRDRVAALMSAYRKIALLEDERGTFNKVRNLLGRHAHEKGSPEASSMNEWLKQLKQMHKGILGQSRVMAYQLEKPDGSTEELKPETIIDWLVNGVVSHSDPEARERWDALGGWGNGGLLMNV